MPTIIDSLLISVGFKINPEGLEGFAKKTEEAKHMALGLGAALAGAVYGIEHMVHGAVERMGGIQDFSEQMGLSARSVDALGRVARENESSLEAMEGGLRSMTMMAGQAAQGVGRGAMIFKRFGINVKDTNGHVKSTDQLLGDVADRLQRLPSLAQKQALGARLGFDPATIKLLSEGRAHFNKLREDALAANPFQESDYEQAELTEKAFRKAGDAVTKLKERLAIGLLPTVNVLLARFKGWAQDENNINKIRDAINKVVEVAGFLVRHMGLLVSVLATMKAHAYGTMIMGWGAALTSMAASAGKGASMVALLGAGFKAMQGILTAGVLGLLILAAEDLYTFHRGGVSVTGWMLTKFPQAVDAMVVALDVLGAAFIGLSLSSGPVGVFAFAIGGIIISAMALKDAWNPVMQWFGEAWDSLADKVASWVNTMDTPLRLAAKLFGIDLSMNENHAATRNAEFNATYGPMQRHREEVAQRQSLKAGGMLPGMGTFGALMPGLGIGVRPAMTSVSTVNVGDIHLHVDGSNLNAGDSERLFREFSAKLAARGIPQNRDASRVKTLNGQTGAY
jgi:hypothetical protein